MAEEKGFPGWMLGCGIGCLGIIVLLGGVLVWGAFQMRDVMEQAGSEFKQELPGKYARLKEQGKVPEAHTELCDRLVALLEREETGFFGVFMGSSALLSMLEDGKLTDEEQEALQAFTDYIEENPAPNPVDLGTFMEEHPILGQGDKAMDFSLEQPAAEEPANETGTESEDTPPAEESVGEEAPAGATE